MKEISAALVVIITAAAIFPTPAIAGPAADALGTCLSDNTTGKERKELAKWIFAGMSAHPDMQPLSSVTEAHREEIDRKIAALVTRLMTENCRSQAQSALEKEGAQSFQDAFAAMGKLAMQELVSDPKVNSAMGSYSKHLDTKKLNSAFSGK